MRTQLIFPFLLILLLFSISVESIGVGTYVKQIEFEPYLNQNFPAFINNNVGKPVRILLKARGDLAQYVTFSEEYLDIDPGGRGHFSFNLKLPESIPPGRNRFEVGGEDITGFEGGGIQARTAAYKSITVIAPHVGKYLTVTLDIPLVQTDTFADFSLRFNHQGSEVIELIQGTVDVFAGGVSGTKVGSVPFAIVEGLLPGDIEARAVRWDISGQPVGNYHAVAQVDYDGITVTERKDFKIGDLTVALVDHTKEFVQDGIARLTLDVQSHWSDPIERVYAEVLVGELQLKTPEVTLEPWQKESLVTYLDTDALGLGTHSATVKIHYSGEVFEKDILLTVLDKPIEEQLSMPSASTLLIVIIALLVISNVILVVIYLRHLNTGQKKKK